MLPNRTTGVIDAAREYIRRGWQVVPLAPKSKACVDDGWLKLIFKPDDFHPDDNIGIRSVGGLVDIDMDAPEAVAVAGAFMPATGAIYGRPSKPRSHWLYKSKFERTIALRDLGRKDDSNLLELRVQHQSMAPPSVHPSGELVEWEVFEDAPTIDEAELLRACRLVATCALIARYYNPPHNRHDWGLALSATLRGLSITEAEANRIFTEAARLAGDGNVSDRLSCVRTTYQRSDDDPLKGSSELKNLMADAKSFLQSLNKVWGSAASAFILDEKGEKILANNQENIRRAVAKLEVVLSYDEFSHRALLTRGNTVHVLDDERLNRLYLEVDSRFHFRPSLDFFSLVVNDTAHQTPVHPVKEYLAALKWDGVPRLDEWLIKLAKAADTPYVRAVSSLVLVAAVRRVRKPGCMFQEMLILESPQGYEKSSALQALCPVSDWFSDDMPLNVDAKQVIERTSGKWIVEAAELAGMRGSQVEHLKRLLSAFEDGPCRMAYARLPISRRRQFIIIGTTNDHAYLKDPTGGRRFWPVRVDRFNIEALRKVRDQLWAEAAFRESRGDDIRLPRHLWDYAAMQQERRRSEDPWEDLVMNALPKNKPKLRVTREQLWNAVGVPPSSRDETGLMRLGRVMQRLGYRKMVVRTGNKVEKGWGWDASQQELRLMSDNSIAEKAESAEEED